MDAEQTIDSANEAADDAADKAADRTGSLIADISTMRGALRNPLRLRSERDGHRCSDDARKQPM